MIQKQRCGEVEKYFEKRANRKNGKPRSPGSGVPEGFPSRPSCGYGRSTATQIAGQPCHNCRRMSDHPTLLGCRLHAGGSIGNVLALQGPYGTGLLSRSELLTDQQVA